MLIRIIKPALSALVQIVVLVAAVVWILDSGAQTMGYSWQWERVPDYIAFYEDGEWWPAELVEGLLVTINISLISLVATLIIGLTTALLRNSNSVVGRTLATSYVELIRNTPLLVQIYLLYFVFGPVLGLDRFSTAVLALALFQGAYTAEIFRAGLNGIARGQFEAAQSLGLSKTYTYWDVILSLIHI